MPNNQNIDSPITLISFGRSGTTLVSNIFEYHSKFQNVNETTNLIFGTWQAVVSSSGVTPPLFKDGVYVTKENLAGRVVRKTFLTCFPDNRSNWFQKPIGIPNSLPNWRDDGKWQDAASSYWQVMKMSFPKAKYFTILRHPCDVVLSAKSYWGYDETALWQSLAFMAYLINHPESPVKYAIHFEELCQDNEKVIRDLFTFLDIPFQKQVINAFSTIHVPSKMRGNLKNNQETLHHNWSQLNPKCVNQYYIDCIAKLFDTFDYDLNLPKQFKSNFDAKQLSTTSISEGGQQSEEELKREIIDLRRQIAKLHQEYTAKIQEETILNPIYQTRAWRLVNKYWFFKERLRYFYRLIIPDKIRIAFRILRHPEEKELYQQRTNKPKKLGPILFKTEVADKSRYQRPKSAMKIVYLCWTIPLPLDSGGKIRSYNLLRYLAEHHEVHLHVPSWQPIDIPEEFKELFASITIYRFRYVEWKKDHRFRIAKGIPRNITGHYTNESLLEFQKLFSAQAGELIFVDESVVAPYAWSLSHTPSILARQKAEHLFYSDVFRRTPLGIAKIKALIEALLYRVL